MLQLAQTTSAAPTSLVQVGLATATTEGLLAYDKDTTPTHLALVLDALAAPKVRDTPDQALDELLTGQLQRAAVRLGHRNAATDPLTVNLWVKEIATLLRERWHYLTTAEIEQVFRLGSLAQLLPPADRDGRPVEEVVYLSPKTVGVWLTRYKYQVKTEAMAHAQRLAYQACELPLHHPVHAAWRIARVQLLLGLEPRALRQLTAREGDLKSLLYQWLKEIGALGFRPKPPGFWTRVEALEKRRLRRTGQRPPEEHLLEVAQGKRERYADRLLAAVRWRALCLWLAGQRSRQAEIPALLWPLALALYSPPTPPTND